MKKVLIVALYPTESCPVFSLEFAKALQNNGCEVYALIADNMENKQSWIDLLSRNRIALVKLDKSRNFVLSKLQKYTNILSYTLKKKKILKNIGQIHFDLVFYTFFHRWNGILKRDIQSKNHILFVHDPLPHSDEKANRKKRQAKQIGTMDRIIVLSKKFIKVCQTEYGYTEKNILYMPHCVMNYNKEKKATPYHNLAGIHFLFFGRITKYKGLNILLRSFKKVESEFPNATLTVAGSGEFEEYREAFSALSHATLLNRYIDDREIDTLFTKENTVCVVPYTDATQSGVIAIAMDYGTAVIASDTGGLKEQLDDGALGIYCVPGDETDLTEKMLSVCRNASGLIREAQKMTEYAKTLDWDYATHKLLKNSDETCF